MNTQKIREEAVKAIMVLLGEKTFFSSRLEMALGEAAMIGLPPGRSYYQLHLRLSPEPEVKVRAYDLLNTANCGPYGETKAVEVNGVGNPKLFAYALRVIRKTLAR